MQKARQSPKLASLSLSLWSNPSYNQAICEGVNSNMTTYKLSPSDLTFLWSDCRRCFYLKVVHKIARPAAPMPAIFTRIDGLMKDYFKGRSTAELAPSLPAGVVQHGERWVESQPVQIEGRAAACYLRGKFDTVVQFDDDGYGVVDFKTSEAKPAHLSFYSRQLHAYAYALEHPAPGKLSLQPVTRLGLLVVEPQAMQRTPDGRIAYLGSVTWQEMPRDDAGFLTFLGEVLAVLDSPEPPPPGESCKYCEYRSDARRHGH